MKLLIFQIILIFSEKFQLDDGNTKARQKRKSLERINQEGRRIFSAPAPREIFFILEVKHPSGRITQQIDQCPVFLRGYHPADHKSGSSPAAALY